MKKGPRRNETLACHHDSNGGWVTLQIEAAVQYEQRERMRCPECWGPVRAHREGRSGTPCAHFEHLRAHKGCRYSYIYNGKRTRHPDALTKALSKKR